MKFSDTKTARTYSDRSVDPSWVEWCTIELSPCDKAVVDIGCGGGIYSRGFLECGAQSVVGIDSSEQYVVEARTACPGATFHVAQCHATGLGTMCADIVFERALIHHLIVSELVGNANEVKRLLKRIGD